MSPANVPIFQFKTVIVAAGVLLLIQGIAQVCRCMVCIKTGKWPEHAEDVEEMESILLKKRDLGAVAEGSHALPGQDGQKDGKSL